MKRASLTPGMHVLVSGSPDWHGRPGAAERYRVLDTLPWRPTSAYRRGMEQVETASGPVLTTARLERTGPNVLLEPLTLDGKPRTTSHLDEAQRTSGIPWGVAIPLGQIRGEWDTTWEDVSTRARLRRDAVERERAAREALEAHREATAQTAARALGVTPEGYARDVKARPEGYLLTPAAMDALLARLAE